MLSVLTILLNISMRSYCPGDSFGLDAATGVSRFLEEKGIGFDVGPTKIPIVPTAVIFDILFGDRRQDLPRN